MIHPLRSLARWLLAQPSPAERLDALCLDLEQALARRRQRRAAYQERARKGASTRIHNRRACDRLAGTLHPEGE